MTEERDERSLWIAVVAVCAALGVIIAVYASGTSKAPLDERLRLGLLSDAAAMRWQREGRLIGLTVEQLQDAFGIDNVHVRDDSDVALSYESDLLAHIECTMRAGRVESSRVVIP